MPFILLILYLLIEIALFIWIGGMIGVGWTLLWVLAGFIVGVMMLRHGGSESRKWLEQASKGAERGPVSRQIYWYIGGLLVILPGFFTDFLGLALVFPPTQAIVTWIFSLFIPESVQTGFAFVANLNPNASRKDKDVIDGEVVEVVEIDDPQLPNDHKDKS